MQTDLDSLELSDKAKLKEAITTIASLLPKYPRYNPKTMEPFKVKTLTHKPEHLAQLQQRGQIGKPNQKVVIITTPDVNHYEALVKAYRKGGVPQVKAYIERANQEYKKWYDHQAQKLKTKKSLY